jgi:hypothetical protein
MLKSASSAISPKASSLALSATSFLLERELLLSLSEPLFPSFFLLVFSNSISYV